jgi:hypothetical protein
LSLLIILGFMFLKPQQVFGFLPPICYQYDQSVYCVNGCEKFLGSNYYKSPHQDGYFCKKTPGYIKLLDEIQQAIVENSSFLLILPLLAFVIFYIKWGHFKIFKLIYLIFVYLQPPLFSLILIGFDYLKIPYFSDNTFLHNPFLYFSPFFLILFILDFLVTKFIFKLSLAMSIAYCILLLTWAILRTFIFPTLPAMIK